MADCELNIIFFAVFPSGHHRAVMLRNQYHKEQRGLQYLLYNQFPLQEYGKNAYLLLVLLVGQGNCSFVILISASFMFCQTERQSKTEKSSALYCVFSTKVIIISGFTQYIDETKYLAYKLMNIADRRQGHPMMVQEMTEFSLLSDVEFSDRFSRFFHQPHRSGSGPANSNAICSFKPIRFQVRSLGNQVAA